MKNGVPSMIAAIVAVAVAVGSVGLYMTDNRAIAQANAKDIQRIDRVIEDMAKDLKDIRNFLMPR